MSTRLPTRRILAGLVTTAALAGGLGAAAAAPAHADDQPTRTKVTVKIAHCDGCTVHLVQAIEGEQDVWQSRVRDVVDGEAHFSVPVEHTAGMSLDFTAPWENHIGAVTTAAFHYPGHQVGDKVTKSDALGRSRASGCFAGTDQRHLTLRLRAVQIPVQEEGKGTGTTLFAVHSTAFDKPMYRAYHGRLGTQDATWCRLP
ncbi:hypothetical protein [Nocardioides acrostichi]|uniref:Uncharacterized protein n=1 Tax=Nocardioides acrostichi TaxID=2784339 RepID=A0A930UWF4_9ACTN|nr:hypothetical protein [Nocardioides acrostichi]MBF4160917.1 hypothetical protein [Nocardioides acrostichi]